MGRALCIVVLVGLLAATGVAFASPVDEVRLPMTFVGSAGKEAPPVEVVVEKGDHLWKISARHLAIHAPERRVAPYWLRVIEVNGPNLRSGDPDLIYPGEVIELPEVSERP